MLEKNKTMSIILLSYFSESRIVNVFNKTKEIMNKENIPFEFIIIDDGSKDKSYEIALELENENSNVHAYQLSKNYTTHYAKFAGFSISNGACIVSMPDDFQQPLETYVTMYRLWQQGHKLIIPYRVNRNDGKVKDFFSNIYYRIMNKLSDVELPEGGADVFLADREIIDILVNKIHPINTSTTIEVLRLGFDPYFFPFNRPKVKSKSRWTFKKKVKLAKDTFFSSSSFPIIFVTYIGFISFLISIFLIFISIYLKIYKYESIGGISVPGWTSTLIITSFFSGIILLSLGIISEYIWRIMEEVKNRPGYIIKSKNTIEQKNLANNENGDE